MVKDLVQSMRYRSWTKNLLVFGALLFVPGAVMQTEAVTRCVLAFIGFCLLSGGLYIVNDVTDIKRDRNHPLKKNRPIASGRVPTVTALIFALFLFLICFAISAWIDNSPFEVSSFGKVMHVEYSVTITFFAYFILTILYTTILKRISILDVIIIAIGFVLRAVSGAAALNVVISPWLLLCTFLLSVYLALAKRRGELIQLGKDSVNHRDNLAEYSITDIDQFLSITAATNIISYSLYTFIADNARGSYLMVTIPMVIFGIFRYQSLVVRKGEGANPEEILLNDRPLQIDILLWIIAVVLIFKFS
ncbi:decaprenyl-phosphate phosphoribosyltransferase [bacterium]|nr:decaprenyl-phosphate phosphoribosyltransferase [bacterium]MBU1025987.1 decaprenyl-phosphate phosphoribosyltransferase [bacterium]